MFIRFGPTELLLVMGLMALLFGSRLPAVMSVPGRSITAFTKGLGGGGPWAGV